MAVRAMYKQYCKAVGELNFEPVISFGIGDGSSQWTICDEKQPDDITKFKLVDVQVVWCLELCSFVA